VNASVVVALVCTALVVAMATAALVFEQFGWP
jgi:multisubunit Na+/H+ antiporter MnhC subunit